MESTQDDLLHDDVAAVASYHSLSVLAIVALVVGLFSPLALVTPVLIFIPAVALFLALLALHQISSSEGLVVGRGLALTALALAICFGTATLGGSYIQTWLLTRQARPWAEVYIDLVRDGQLAAAYELSLPAQQRLALNEDVEKFYAGDDARTNALSDFAANPVVSMLQSLAPDEQVVFVGNVSRQSSGAREYVGLQYQAKQNKPTSNEQTFTIVMEKQPGVGGLPAAWVVFAPNFDVAP